MKTIEQYGRSAWVLGSPIEHTLSPPIHNRAFMVAELSHRYFAMEVEPQELEEFLQLFQKLNGLGANFTIPLKEKICDHIAGQTEPVKALGAANTLFWEQDHLVLDNTDVYGFTALLRPWHDRVSDDPVVLLGAGGAARACLYALGQLESPRIYLWNRTRERAEQLEQEFSRLPIHVLSRDQLESGDFETTLVINSTSLGLDPGDPSPFPSDQIGEAMVGVDLIYHHETQFMQDFTRMGDQAVGGLGMLVHQAARAWERWTGQVAPVEAMMETARNELRS